MVTVRKASSSDIPLIKALDHLMPCELERERALVLAIDNDCAYAVCNADEILGYGLMHFHFFGHPFIEMVYIAQEHRNQGYGATLMDYMLTDIEAEKVFTSTNLSNNHMKHVLKREGWVESGHVDNLDEGDSEIIFFKIKTP